MTLRIEQSPSIFFKGMEGSIMGCWSSHGEGRAYFPDSSILEVSCFFSCSLVPTVTNLFFFRKLKSCH